MADTDSSKIDVVLNPSSREHREIPPEFPDHLYLPSLGSRSLEHVENKKFQGTDHQQVQNEKFRKRYGTFCIVDERSSKIEAPRNWKECTEFPVREDPEVNANIEVLHNVTIQQDICQEDFIQEKTQNPSSHLPSEEFVPSGATYGTGNALKKLALSHEELKTGRHGVYTDLRYAQILQRTHEDEEKLGSGSNGVVTKGKGPNGLEYVRKRVMRKNFHPTEAIFTNAANHPNIVKLYGLVFDTRIAELIMDFAGQSLQSLITTKSLDKDIILSLILDICSGLVFLESKNMVHLDIKPSNLFVHVDDRKEYRLKIGDFGSARMPEEKKEKIAWTTLYGAPELAQLNLKQIGHHKKEEKPIQNSVEELKLSLQPKTDMFSFGLTIGYMYSAEKRHLLSMLVPKEKPYSHELNIKRYLAYRSLYEAKIFPKLIPCSADWKMKRIVEGMLEFDVKDRLSATETMKYLEEVANERHIPTRNGDKFKCEKVWKKEEPQSLAPQQEDLKKLTAMGNLKLYQ